MHIKGSKEEKIKFISKYFLNSKEVLQKAEAIKAELKASTWHELETKGKFDKRIRRNCWETL